MSGLRHAQIAMGFEDPFAGKPFPRLEYVLKGIKRAQAAAGNQTRPRLPITPPILSKLFKVWDSTANPDSAMLKAACCLAFFGFLRSAEFTAPSASEFDPSAHLSFRDIAIDSRSAPSLIRIHIKQSKTDPFRQGVFLYIGRSHANICPVHLITQYLAARGGRDGPLFLHADHSPLTRSSLVHHLKTALTSVGIDPNLYNSHSFRIGAATTAAARGIDSSLIQTLGRWESAAYLRYVRVPRSDLAAISQVLMAQPSHESANQS